MSLYVPQMQQSNIGAYRSEGMANVAKSFLDGVRISNDAKHKKNMQENELKRIDLQNRQLEADKQFRDRALGLQEHAGVRQQQMFNQALKAQQREKELVKGVVDYKVDKNLQDQQVVEKANQLYDGPIDEKESYWFKPDVHGTDGWEFYQYQPTRKMAETLLKKEGKLIEPKIDENLYKNIQDRRDLGLLDYLQGTGQSLYNNIFGGE